MIVMWPPLDEPLWPTLGPDVCAWIEENLCHGPGDLLGDPVELNDEHRFWARRLYEVYPPFRERRRRGVISKSRHPRAGKRRFGRCVLSLRKGSAKTEFAAWIAAAELHPSAPVRCVNWRTHRGEQVPEGSGVRDPYIPMISYTEEQTEELAYGALRRILEECDVGRDFDIGIERIVRLGGDGKAEAVSGSPNARDGARTTFQHADETHRFTLEALRSGWKTMLANLGKRPLADPWALETTTAPEPGGGSVAEASMEFARIMAAQVEPSRSRLFFFHREASERHDLTKDRGLRAALVEASGPYVAAWSDFEPIIDMFREPDADRTYLERVYLNRPVQSDLKAFDVPRFRSLKRRNFTPPDFDAITLGFDGSRYEDATGLVGTHVETGYQWVLGVWEKPPVARTQTGAPWEVMVDEVNGVVQDAFDRWTVLRMYADPEKWESWVAQWAGQKGDKVVLEWWTNRRKPMAYAIRSYIGAIAAGELSHDGDETFLRHVANAYRAPTNLVDEKGQPLWILRKERPDSPNKIDLAMAGILSWEARNDVIAAGDLVTSEFGVEFVEMKGEGT